MRSWGYLRLTYGPGDDAMQRWTFGTGVLGDKPSYLNFLALGLIFAAGFADRAWGFAGSGKQRACPVLSGNVRIQATVLRVSDGDTLSALLPQNIKANIRFLGIDTPELHFPWGGQIHQQAPYGQMATDELARWIKPGDAVVLELDQEPCDLFGRVLAYVWKGRININAAMLGRGYAVTYCMVPNLKYCESFSRASARAVTRRLGLFRENVEPAYIFRNRIRNEAPKRFVGDLTTRKVYAPEYVSEIPVQYRIFFNTLDQIKPPYVYVP